MKAMAKASPEMAKPLSPVRQTWRMFAANQSALRLHAEEWAWKLAESRDLASQLVEFSGKVLKKTL